MQVSNLKNGMCVRFRNGSLGRVIKETKHGDLIVSSHFVMNIPSTIETICDEGITSKMFWYCIEETGLYKNDHNFDIMEIYQPIDPIGYDKLDLKYMKKIYSRFNIKDFKSGMIVILRNMDSGRVFLDSDYGEPIIVFNSGIWKIDKSFNDDLIYIYKNKDYDIIEVRKPITHDGYLCRDPICSESVYTRIEDKIN